MQMLKETWECTAIVVGESESAWMKRKLGYGCKKGVNDRRELV